MVTEQQRRQLAEDLPRDVVKTREQAGQRLSYVDGWYAVSRANEVFGPDGWSYATREIREVYRGTRPGRDGENTVIVYEAVVSVTALGITREDVGIGQCDASLKALAQGIEKARKEAVTDGLKRALRTFGPSFGLALYDKDQKDVGISRAAMALRDALAASNDPDAFAREHADELRSLDDDERDELRTLLVARRQEVTAQAAQRAASVATAPEAQPITLPDDAQRVADRAREPAPASPQPIKLPDAEPAGVADLCASIRACATPGDVVERWAGSRDDRAAWSKAEVEAAQHEAVARVAALRGVDTKAARAWLTRELAGRGPKNDGPRGGSKSAPQATPADAHGSAQDGAQGAASDATAQHPEAWRETAAGIRAHVAGIGNIPRLANSARKHLRAIPTALRNHAVQAYAERFAALAHDVDDAEAMKRAETWLREGPTVTDLPARPKRPTLRAAAVGER